MTLIPGVYLVTIKDPALYTHAQLDLACLVAEGLDRGMLLLCEPPRR